MVGYENNETLSPNQKLFAGCVSGVMTRFITQPLDVIKLRTQLQKKTNRKFMFYRITKKILREEGITAFWHGHFVGQIHSVLAVSTQFYVYELSTRQLSSIEMNKRYKSFICGLFAGCASATVVIPLEVIRVRQMIVNDQYGGLLKGAKQVYSSGGILAFYEGLSASLLQVINSYEEFVAPILAFQMGPAAGISFTVFSFVQPLLFTYLTDNFDPIIRQHATSKTHKAEFLLLSSTLAGSLAGFTSKSLTYPFDMAKRRLQIGSHKEDNIQYRIPSSSKNLASCNKLVQCLTDAFKKHGIKGLFQGWKVTVYKAQLTSIVAFTTYEMICYSIRELNLK